MKRQSNQDFQFFPSREEDRPGLVSILISNYNYAQFVAASIESAAGQSYPNVEIIVVDDGSTDRSVETISALQARIPSLRLVVQENAGQAAAMNRAFALAKGRYVVFLDSDDLLDSDAVSEAVAAVRPDTAFVQYYLRTVDGLGLPTGLHAFSHMVESGDMFRQILSSGHFRFMPTSGNLFVRAALGAVFPIPEKQWRICADTFLVAAAASAGRVETLPKILGSYRTHGANAWYREREGPDRLPEISRNHVQLWLDLFPVIRKSRHRSFDDHAALSLIRRAAIGLSVAPPGSFSAAARANHLRALRSELKSLNVSMGERLWHRLILRTAGSSDPRASLRDLLVHTRRSPAIAWLHDRLVSARRHDWLKNAPLPASLLDLVPGQSIEFGRGGNGAGYLWYGFGSSENWSNWASSESAGLVFKVPAEYPGLDLQVNLQPGLKPPDIAEQSICVEANGTVIFEGKLAKPGAIDLHLSKAILDATPERIVRLHFRCNDAIVFSLLDASLTSSRLSPFALKSISVRKLEKARTAVAFTIPATISPGPPNGDLIFHTGWDLSGPTARQTGLRSMLRFALPNPAADCFAVIADFVQPPAGLRGDWRVGMSVQGIGSDIVDLRQGRSAVVLVPQGKAPRDGILDVTVASNSFLAINPEAGGKSGIHVKSLRLLGYQESNPAVSVIHDGVPIDCSSSGSGGNYLKSGWHTPDQAGTWASNTVSVFEGLFFDGEREVFLTATVATLVEAAQINRQVVAIVANGVRIAVQLVEGLGQIVAIIPACTIGEDRKLKLEFRGSALGRPSDLGPYEDRRPSSFCLKNIKFEALRPA